MKHVSIYVAFVRRINIDVESVARGGGEYIAKETEKINPPFVEDSI